jgi:hypothetical protein
MACPECGSLFGECRIASSVETHGLDCGPYERFEDESVVCRECGGQFDIRDWDDASELSIDERRSANGTVGCESAL